MNESGKEYIRINSSGLKIIILSVIIVIVSLTVWGFVGKLPVTKTYKSLVCKDTVQDGEKTFVYCFLNTDEYGLSDLEKIKKEVVIKMPNHEEFVGSIREKLDYPITREKLKALFNKNDKILNKCIDDGYYYTLIINTDEDISQYDSMILDVTLEVDEKAPIYFLRGNN